MGEEALLRGLRALREMHEGLQKSGEHEELQRQVQQLSAAFEREVLQRRPASSVYRAHAGLLGLPDELLLRILGHLGPASLARAGQTCWRLQNLVMDASLWRGLFRSSFGSMPSQTPSVGWRVGYVARLLAERNWALEMYTLRNYQGTQSTASEPGGVRAMQFRGGLLAAGMFTSEAIEIFRIFPRRRRVCALHGHTRGAMSLRLIGHRLLSSSRDHTVRVWDVERAQCDRVLSGHRQPVWACDWEGGDVAVSGSDDASVRVWDLRSGTSAAVLHGHGRGVASVAVKDHVVASGSRDNTVRVWDLRQPNSAVHVLEGHTNSVRVLALQDDLLVSGSWDSTLRAWNPQLGSPLGVMVGHSSRVLAVAFDDRRIVSGSFDESILVWARDSYDRLFVLRSHSAPIAHLELDPSHILSGSRDLTIKVWDFSEHS